MRAVARSPSDPSPSAAGKRLLRGRQPPPSGQPATLARLGGRTCVVQHQPHQRQAVDPTAGATAAPSAEPEAVPAVPAARRRLKYMHARRAADAAAAADAGAVAAALPRRAPAPAEAAVRVQRAFRGWRRRQLCRRRVERRAKTRRNDLRRAVLLRNTVLQHGGTFVPSPDGTWDLLPPEGAQLVPLSPAPAPRAAFVMVEAQLVSAVPSVYEQHAAAIGVQARWRGVQARKQAGAAAAAAAVAVAVAVAVAAPAAAAAAPAAAEADRRGSERAPPTPPAPAALSQSSTFERRLKVLRESRAEQPAAASGTLPPPPAARGRARLLSTSDSIGTARELQPPQKPAPRPRPSAPVVPRRAPIPAATTAASVKASPLEPALSGAAAPAENDRPVKVAQKRPLPPSKRPQKQVAVPAAAVAMPVSPAPRAGQAAPPAAGGPPRAMTPRAAATPVARDMAELAVTYGCCRAVYASSTSRHLATLAELVCAADPGATDDAMDGLTAQLSRRRLAMRATAADALALAEELYAQF